jgi:hypothetical protein
MEKNRNQLDATAKSMNKPLAVYEMQVVSLGKYEWTGTILDVGIQNPKRLTVMAKSLPELMAHLLIAVNIYHAQNAKQAESNGTVEAPKLVMP